MTLFREIQNLLEHTYDSVDLNLEECLIGKARYTLLSRQAGSSTRELSEEGRTFMAPGQDHLRLAIFYAPGLIDELERNDPRSALNERNIGPLITFIEEIDHGLQAALLFMAGERHFDQEDFICNLEVQAKVDTFLVLSKLAHALLGKRLPKKAVQWLEGQFFDQSHLQFSSARLRFRYGKAQEVAHVFVNYLRTLPMAKRRAALRRFRSASWKNKLDFCQRVEAQINHPID